MTSGREGMIEMIDREIAAVRQRLREDRGEPTDEDILAFLERYRSSLLLVFQHRPEPRPPGVTLH